MHNKAKIACSFFIACIFYSSAHADQVIGIADGDTLTVMHTGRPLKVRLANIDAPEKRQPWGQRSKQSLSDLCFLRDAHLDIQTIDKYGRTVAQVTCDGVDVNRTQVDRGMAWVYEKYNRDSSLAIAEINARAARVGLWNDSAPMPPWEFRRPATPSIAPKPVAKLQDRIGPVISEAERAQFMGGVQEFGAAPTEGASYGLPNAGSAGNYSGPSAIYAGPRGGQYRINSNGGKTYIRK